MVTDACQVRSPHVRAIGWFVKPIDLDKLDQLYDMRVVLELASVRRLGARSAKAPQFQAFKDPRLAPVTERLTDARQVGAHGE